MADEPQERVVMNWPKALKDQVREVAGNRGITEFCMHAVNVHLGNEDLRQVQKDLDQARAFAQELADQMVLGGSQEDRLQFLIELQVPDWILTHSWPAAYAERLQQVEVPEIQPPEDAPLVEVSQIVPAKPIDLEDGQTHQVAASQDEVHVDGQKVDLPHDAQGDDLFARLKAAGKLKVASEIPQPEPLVQRDLCPTCSEELIDGECWTCAS